MERTNSSTSNWQIKKDKTSSISMSSNEESKLKEISIETLSDLSCGAMKFKRAVFLLKGKVNSI